MKKLIAITCLCLGMIALTSLAHAQSSRLYFAGYLGLNTYTENDFSEGRTGTSGDVEFDNAFSLAGALGLRLTPQWRIEAEISRRAADLDRADFNNASFDMGGELETWLYMVNLFYDLNWEWKNFQPFLMAGVGLAGHETQITDPNGGLPRASDDSLGFGWSLGGGLKYRVDPELALTTNYRYIGTNDIETDSYDVEFTTHEFRIGMEYDLPMDWFRFD